MSTLSNVTASSTQSGGTVSHGATLAPLERPRGLWVSAGTDRAADAATAPQLAGATPSRRPSLLRVFRVGRHHIDRTNPRQWTVQVPR